MRAAITSAQVLAYLKEHGPCTCAEIASAKEQRPALVTSILQELRAEGKVTSTGRTRATMWAVAP